MPTTYRQVMKGFFYHIEANVSFAACMDAEAGWEESLDSPDFCRFLLVSSGQAAITMNGQEYILEPGELFLLPSGTQQACKVYGNGCLRMYWCNFKSFVGEADFFKTMALPVRVRMKEPLHVQELFQKMITALQNNWYTSHLRLRSAFLELVACYIENAEMKVEELGKSEAASNLDEVLAYIEMNLDSVIQVDELARLVCLHPNYFIDFFKNNIGVSPIQYVNNRRMERVKELLQSSDDPVGEIARQVGMQNHYLSRMFKQYTGLSPSRYRKLYQNL